MRRGYAIQPMDLPALTVVVPTRGRAAYLEVTLDSLTRQRARTAHELLVVDDGATDATPEVAARFGVRLVRHGERRSLNAARNTGVREARADLIAFVDDDVVAPPGWVDAVARGRRPPSGGRCLRRPDPGAARGQPRRAPAGARTRRSRRSTSGPEDVEAEMVWGANFAVRRSAIERIGEFDESLDRAHGDEEDWLLRLRAAGGRIVYLAAAGLDHRRSGGRRRPAAPDARRLRPRPRRPLERRRRRGEAPPPRPRAARARRLRLAHAAARLSAGRVMGAHSAGRVAEALRPR